MLPSRFVELYQPSAPANDLAASLEAFDRREHVVGVLLSAAAPPNGMGRGAKGIGRPINFEERVRERRCRQAMAWLEALIEIADHGPTADILGAMHALVLAMDGKLRDRAQMRLGAIEDGEPIADVRVLRRELAAMRAAAATPPPSGTRFLIAADPRYQTLRREAMDALGELTGDLAPGVGRLGGVYLAAQDARDLAGMTRELDVEVLHPSRGNVARMARQAAELVRGIGQREPRVCDKAETAAERLEALASFVERGGAA